ncbi:ATP-binding protein [Nonomuraea sp. K274]|uniref:ATP-binding protein n=1 Tax=Nonomuraea cypriaca TaxID=1187855 RepID=A0A931A2L3_9ACTN|nr:ATP-binding protein [Nonomuraea cypriaca]MBF8185056.1 ATP-binding protein [Nonomuraea cypriaca]
MRNLNPATPCPTRDDDSGEACWDLPAVPESVGTARRLVREALAAWGLSALAEDMTMVVSEVVTNAVVHAKSSMTLSLHRQGESVRGEVADRSMAWPTPLPADLEEEHGRGLTIVAAYSERWGVDPSPDGKTVWFVCQMSASPCTT